MDRPASSWSHFTPGDSRPYAYEWIDSWGVSGRRFWDSLTGELNTVISIDRWMDQAEVVHVYNGVLLSHKKESIWVSSSEVDEPRACYTDEVSQKEKNKYHILMHTYGI